MQEMITYRALEEGEICRALFGAFIRHQVVDLCLRRENGGWAVRPDPFVDDWSEEYYGILVDCLRNTVKTGDVVYGAFRGQELKGFASVESEIFGGENRYLDLTSLHVSEDLRRHGIGGELFHMAARWAAGHGASKLYISSHSAVETQGFYRGAGCVDAAQPNPAHVESEPFDCQLEYSLQGIG